MACCRDPVTFHAELGAANFACGRVQMWEQQRVLHRSCGAQLAIRAERNTIAALAIATRLWILGPEFAADVTIRCRCVARFRRRQHPARKRKARLVAGLFAFPVPPGRARLTRAVGFGYLPAAFRKASLIRSCQPGPPA